MVDSGNGMGHLFAFSQSKKKRSMFKSICNDRAMREKKNEKLFVNLLTPKLGIKKKEIYIESMKITFWKFDLNMSIRV
jgi:hypothetical protein